MESSSKWSVLKSGHCRDLGFVFIFSFKKSNGNSQGLIRLSNNLYRRRCSKTKQIMRPYYVMLGANEQELATPTLSLCHDIFTDWSILSTPFLLWKKGSSGPVTLWRQLVSGNWLWHSHWSLIQRTFDLKINRSMKRPWQKYPGLADYFIFLLFFLLIRPFFLQNSLSFSNWYCSYMLCLCEKLNCNSRHNRDE